MKITKNVQAHTCISNWRLHPQPLSRSCKEQHVYSRFVDDHCLTLHIPRPLATPCSLSCPQTVQGPFPSEETLVRKEKEHSSKVIQPTTRTEDFESLFQAVQQLAVFELPHGKTRRVRPSVIPGNHLSPVIQFQNGRLGDAKLSSRLFR